jgi:hypothetical protein
MADAGFVSAVSYVPYAGIIADDTGESAGGAVATATVAAYEQQTVTPAVSPMVAAPGKDTPGLTVGRVAEVVAEEVYAFVIGDAIDTAVGIYDDVRSGDYLGAAVGTAMLA